MKANGKISVDMGTAENIEAVSIVSTTAMRTVINMKKSRDNFKNPIKSQTVFVLLMTLSHLKWFHIFIKDSYYNWMYQF